MGDFSLGRRDSLAFVSVLLRRCIVRFYAKLYAYSRIYMDRNGLAQYINVNSCELIVHCITQLGLQVVERQKARLNRRERSQLSGLADQVQGREAMRAVYEIWDAPSVCGLLVSNPGEKRQH